MLKNAAKQESNYNVFLEYYKQHYRNCSRQQNTKDYSG